MLIDCHAHLHHRSSPFWEDSDRKLIEAAHKLGIDQLCCSILSPRRPSTTEGFRECNQWVAAAMTRFSGRVLGVERLLFGCDMSMTAGVGKIRAAALGEGDKQRVLGGNMEAILRRRRQC